VLQAIGEPLECKQYNTWNVVVPEGQFLTRVSGGVTLAARAAHQHATLARQRTHTHTHTYTHTHTRPQIGNDNFNEVLAKIRGPSAVAEWGRLQDAMRPLAKAAVLMPPIAFRRVLCCVCLWSGGQGRHEELGARPV
jgi:hypothetical protein